MFVVLQVERETVMTQIIQKFPLFSKRGFLSAWNQNIFKTWFIIPEKSSSFWLQASKKNWWSLLESPNGALTWNLMIWLKRLIFTIWSSKEMARFQGLFWKRWILWKSSILKGSIFFSPWIWQFDRRQDPRDRFGNSKEGILEQRVQIFGFGKGRWPHRGFGCCPVVALHSSVCSTHESSKILSFLL